jgi:hypothetical protein
MGDDMTPEAKAYAQLTRVLLQALDPRDAVEVAVAIHDLIDAKLTKTAGMLHAQMPLNILVGR